MGLYLPGKTLFCLVIIVFCWIEAKTQTVSLQMNSENSILDFRVESLQLENSSMEEALSSLRSKAERNISIGFEKVSTVKGKTSPTISLKVENATLRKILDRFCDMDHRYAYESISDKLINVFPKGAKSDPEDLLNIKVARFTLDGIYNPCTIINYPQDCIPEIQAYLEKKREEFKAKTGVAYGVVGARMIGIMPFPQPIHLDLHDVTVRDILNAIIMSNLKDSSTDYRIPVFGWKYELLNAPNAATGLGGYPQ